ncbi:MAG: tyrosine-type recombinase/integrase [Magnetococcales bacterium]|nr:tyrosine-type recombinase/integrase [Magnetococcales bacterium]
MPLTDTTIRQMKPGPKTFKRSDGGGLFIQVEPRGSKLWRLFYRFGGKQKLLALGRYPETTLKKAREQREDARRLLAEGIDPGEHRKTTKAAQRDGLDERLFQSVALEWFAKFKPGWAPSHASKVIRRLEVDIFPWLGKRPINEITAPELLAVLRRIESRGALDTAHRAKQNCGQVFRYAVATGRAERDPSADLKGALPPAKGGRFATIIDPKTIGQLLRDIEEYKGSFVTKCALRLAPLVFVRPGELRRAEWAEINLDGAEWRIPEEKMKAGALHVVPLSSQAVAILREIQPLTGSGRYVFPGARSDQRPMSENTVLAALRRLGYAKGEMSGHGFRSMASTRLNEMGFKPDWIEAQLAHAEQNEVRRAYNHVEYLEERRKMMQAWANYLDALRDGAEVVPIRRQA